MNGCCNAHRAAFDNTNAVLIDLYVQLTPEQLSQLCALWETFIQHETMDPTCSSFTRTASRVVSFEE
jgi:hypothetical protein